MNATCQIQTSFRQTLSRSCAPRPLPVAERRERDFGIGYGNSSGYASGRRYTPRPGTTRFRFT